MRVLLDTHTLLWFALDDPSLSVAARAIIVDPANEKWVSPASWWEIGIKMSIGKYTLTVPHDVFFESAIAANGFLVVRYQTQVLDASEGRHRQSGALGGLHTTDSQKSSPATQGATFPKWRSGTRAPERASDPARDSAPRNASAAQFLHVTAADARYPRRSRLSSESPHD